MTYTPLKPDGGPSPDLDAPTIQTNFSQFGTIFSKNHVGMNLKGQGDHSTVILENQSSDPGVDSNFVAIYNKNASSNAGSQPQLFMQIPKFLPTEYDHNVEENLGIQLTYNQVNTAGPNQYQSFLPGGYLLFFGSTSNIAINITLSPAPTKILTAIATANNLNLSSPFNVSTTIVSTSSFKINSNATGVYTFGWWAICQA